MPGKVKTPVQGSRWTLPLLALTFMIGAFGCGPVAEPDGPALEYRSREAGEDGFAGLPVVQMAYVCNESYELCLFEDGGFDEGIGLEDTPPTQYNGEVPWCPKLSMSLIAWDVLPGTILNAPCWATQYENATFC